MTTPLERIVADDYPPDQCVVTRAQTIEWTHSRPLDGIRILDCTPLFRNTLAKFIPLLAGGADLTIGTHPEIPSDPAVVKLAQDLGLAVHEGVTFDPSESFDVVLDCAARHRRIRSTYGYVELTHSGLAGYKNCEMPVVMVDHSPIKLLETMCGTGESCLRALKQLGHEPNGRPMVIFGAGKVGSGIAHGARAEGIEVLMIDRRETAANYLDAPMIDLHDHDEACAAIGRGWTVVTATGVPGALAPFAEAINDSSAIVANMGVDDEFGPDIPESRVLNAKRPVNFILKEPTLMRYMDPVFALSNASAIDLVLGRIPTGIQRPQRDSESSVVADLHAAGSIETELAWIRTIGSGRVWPYG